MLASKLSTIFLWCWYLVWERASLSGDSFGEAAALLPSYHYHDNVEHYEPQEILAAMKKEFDKLRQKDTYAEHSKSQLSAQQLQKIVKRRWVIADRPDASTTTSGELRARCVAKEYSQQVENPIVDTNATRIPD